MNSTPLDIRRHYHDKCHNFSCSVRNNLPPPPKLLQVIDKSNKPQTYRHTIAKPFTNNFGKGSDYTTYKSVYIAGPYLGLFSVARNPPPPLKLLYLFVWVLILFSRQKQGTPPKSLESDTATMALVENIAIYYADDLPSPATQQQELLLWHSRWKCVEKSDLPIHDRTPVPIRLCSYSSVHNLNIASYQLRI